ncbi:MAG: putative peptidoglycan lipid flippase [Alphaproteobacteria bacterium]|jgi:putative peptidoglycan lipid II flippase|nr:putative peptidoglycan lipid flippase [Alphaproteobacteria bacterium]
MSLARDVTTVGGGTLVSRLLGFARDAGFAAVLGSGPFSEAFFAVLQLVNFFRRLLAEGAINGAFAPLWLRLRNGTDGAANADRFTRGTLLAMGGLTAALSIAAFLLAPLIVLAIAPGFDAGRREMAWLYLITVAPYFAFAGPVAVLAAALLAEGRVAVVTISTIAFNVVLLVAILATIDQIHTFLVSVWFAAAITLAGLIQLVIIAAAWAVTGKRWRRPRGPAPGETRRFFARALPTLVAAGIPQLTLIAGAMVASSAPSAVSWLYYANRLYELPLGVASIAIAGVIVPHIAAGVQSRGAGAVAAAQSRALEITLGLTLPAALALALLAGPIAGVLFERGAFGATDTAAVAAALAAICAGLPGHTLEKVFGAVSFAHEDTRTPMLAALAGLAAAAGGALALFPAYGHVGVAAAIALAGWVGAAILGAVLARRRWLAADGDLWPRLRRIAAVTVMMGIVLVGLRQALAANLDVTGSALARIASLAVLVTGGLAVYLAGLELFGVARLKDLLAAVRHRDPTA